LRPLSVCSVWCTFNNTSFEAVEAFVIVLFCLSIPSIFPSDEPQQSSSREDAPKSTGVFFETPPVSFVCHQSLSSLYPIPEGQKKGLVHWLRNYLHHIIRVTLGFKPPPDENSTGPPMSPTTTTIQGSDGIVKWFISFVPTPVEESPKKRGCFRAFGHTGRLHVDHDSMLWMLVGLTAEWISSTDIPNADAIPSFSSVSICMRAFESLHR
jgi:hypothetical protein